MDETEFEKLAGMVAKIAYEIHDKEGIDEGEREMLMDLWREFDCYNHLND